MSDLDNPIQLRCGQELPNRIAMAPLTNTQSNDDGTLHQREFKWLKLRAGHFGLVSTCATYISQEGKAWEGQLGISDDKHIPGLQELTNEIKSRGSKIITQLHHAGAKADQAPQKISTVDNPEDNVKGATKEDITRITQDFVNAARRAEKAGFDGIEVHGANGYIFTQFLSTDTNTRNDEYGGDIEGRARFLRETVQAIHNSVSKDFMINVRISPVDTWAKRGLLLEDSIQVAKWLAEDGVDVISLSLRDAAGAPPFEDIEIPVTQAIREAVPTEVKIAAAGGIWSREDAEMVESKGADIVVLGKVSIVHPDWPEVSKQEGFEPKKPKWNPEIFPEVNVSPKFHEYLNKFPGLVEGGTPSRN